MALQNRFLRVPDGSEGKALIGVTDRALAILAALLSFYPDSELSEENGLIVFPSNKQLSLRAHGMPDTTLRRHLNNLVDCGVIIRRDSPNGKRYARKSRGGDLEEAFGFSVAPLLARAEEFQDAAERVQADNQALKLMRERITLYRRDIGKLIEAAVEAIGAAFGSGSGRSSRHCHAERRPVTLSRSSPPSPHSGRKSTSCWFHT